MAWPTAAMLVLLTVQELKKVQKWGGLSQHDVCAKSHENPSTSSKVIMVTQTYEHVDMYVHLSNKERS
jgi:hypothetical protein